MGSSRTRDRTCVPCIGRRLLNHCATREAPRFVIVIAIQIFNTVLFFNHPNTSVFVDVIPFLIKSFMHPIWPSLQTLSLYFLCLFDTLVTNPPSYSINSCQSPPSLPLPITSTHPPCLPTKEADLSAAEGTKHIFQELGKRIQNCCDKWS